METKNIRIKNPDESFSETTYRELKDYSYSIIEGNVYYGCKLICQGEITKTEVREYKKSAIKELRVFLRKVRENENVVIPLDPITKLYKIVEDKDE